MLAAPSGTRLQFARIMSYGDRSAASRAPINGGWTWNRTRPLATSVPQNANIAPGDDYQYDEAHDVPAGRCEKLLRHIVSIRQR